MNDVITITYLVGTLGMLAGVPTCFRLLSENDGNGHFGYLLIIPGFAALMYGLMTLDIGALIVDGYHIPIPRYIDWLVTTPVLIGYTAYVAGASRKWILGAIVADVLMIGLGAWAIVATPPLRWIAFTLSALCQVVLLGVLYGVLPSYAKDQPSERRRLARILRTHVGPLWIAYPVVWIFGTGLQMISATATAIIFTFVDVTAKVPFVFFVYRVRHVFNGVSPSTSEVEAPGSPAVAASGQ